jgi:hypothetical protein
LSELFGLPFKRPGLDQHRGLSAIIAPALPSQLGRNTRR